MQFTINNLLSPLTSDQNTVTMSKLVTTQYTKMQTQSSCLLNIATQQSQQPIIGTPCIATRANTEFSIFQQAVRNAIQWLSTKAQTGQTFFQGMVNMEQARLQIDNYLFTG